MCLCVPVGRLLGFIVSKDGIALNPLKVQDILELPIPHTLCQLQSLQSKEKFLCQFVPDYATTAHGFLRILLSTIPFVWDEHAQQYFCALKHAITFAPLISPPNFERDFIMYISASTH